MLPPTESSHVQSDVVVPCKVDTRLHILRRGRLEHICWIRSDGTSLSRVCCRATGAVGPEVVQDCYGVCIAVRPYISAHIAVSNMHIYMYLQHLLVHLKVRCELGALRRVQCHQPVERIMTDSARRNNGVKFPRNSSVERGPLRHTRPCAGPWVRSAGGIDCKKVPEDRGSIYAAEKQAAENKTGREIHGES